MTTTVRDVGDRERFSATFTDISGNAANPSVVTFTIRTPDGLTASAATTDSPNLISNASTGVFTYDYTYSQEGRHYIEVVGTGALVASVAGERYVRRSNVS